MRRLIIPILLFFILLLQAITDIFHSATLFPFVHYAMFSEKFAKTDTARIFEIKANNKLLSAADFTINQWSMIHSPLIAISKFQDLDQLAFDQAKILQKETALGVSKLLRTSNLNMQNDSLSFSSITHWYNKYLSSVLNRPVQSLEVNKVTYVVRNGKYIQVQIENWINL